MDFVWAGAAQKASAGFAVCTERRGFLIGAIVCTDGVSHTTNRGSCPRFKNFDVHYDDVDFEVSRTTEVERTDPLPTR